MRSEFLEALVSLAHLEKLEILDQKGLKEQEEGEVKRVTEEKWDYLAEKETKVKKEKLEPKDPLDCLVQRENLDQLDQWE